MKMRHLKRQTYAWMVMLTHRTNFAMRRRAQDKRRRAEARRKRFDRQRARGMLLWHGGRRAGLNTMRTAWEQRLARPAAWPKAMWACDQLERLRRQDPERVARIEAFEERIRAHMLEAAKQPAYAYQRAMLDAMTRGTGIVKIGRIKRRKD